MIVDDPLLIDREGGDFHLTFDSPCRDTGDDTVVAELFDIEGDPRRAWVSTVDIGADEFYTHYYCTGDFIPYGEVKGTFIGMPGASPVGAL